MPSYLEHFKKIKRDKIVYEYLLEDRSVTYEWCIIISFYIVIHYLEAYLDKNTFVLIDYKHPQNHNDRERFLNKTILGKENQFMTGYRRLKELATNARYLDRPVKINNLDEAIKLYNVLSVRLQEALINLS